MKVYLLLGTVAQEGDDILGVYSNIIAADVAKEQAEINPEYFYVDYTISELEVKE